MSRFLVVTWDGAGNLVPTLALAGRLARIGHDVRILGHRSIERRCGSHGWRFQPFNRTIDVDSAAAARDGAELLPLARELWFGASVAADVREELGREGADVVIADCMLFGALAASEAAGCRTVALFHGAFTVFRAGPFADLLSSFLADLNQLRAGLGLDPVTRVSDVHDACALSIVATPKEFEPSIPVPANVRFAGPLLDAPPLMRSDEDVVEPGPPPSIVVSLSTSDQGQLPTIQRIVTALSAIQVSSIVTSGPAIDTTALIAGRNVRIARFVPHDRLLRHASLVVTHAGLGTVMSSLAHGVPLLCLPFGRDQFFNAARVESLGAGRTIARDTDEGTLRAVIAAMVADDRIRAAARSFAQVIGAYRNGEAAVSAVQNLARESPRQPLLPSAFS